MRRTGAWMRGLSTAALLSVSLSLAGVFAPAAEALDNPRQGEWYLDYLHMPDVWQVANGSGVTVAVVDSGVKADHPDLAGQVLGGQDFSGLPGGAHDDPEGHGTRMSSIIAGTGKGVGGNGVIGLAPGAKILPVKVNVSDDGTSSIPISAFLKQVDQAITYAADNGAKVINLSLGVSSYEASPSDVADLQSAVDHAISRGAIVVAAAGNSGQQDNAITYPANSAGAAAIAAIAQNGTTTAESEHGPYIALVAPGTDIVDACTGTTGYCSSHGTSDSAAMVSAAAAILFSEHPTWTGNQVLRVLIDTANRAKDGAMHTDSVGYGGVSIRSAVRYTGDPGPADVNPLVQAGISVTPPSSAFLPGTASSAVPSAGASGQPSSPSSSGPAPVSSPAAPGPAKSASPSSSSSNLPLIGGIAVAAVLVIGGAAFFLARRKRAATAFDPQPAPFGQEPPYGYPMPPEQAQAPQQDPYGSTTPPPPGQPPYQAPPPPAGNPYREG